MCLVCRRSSKHRNMGDPDQVVSIEYRDFYDIPRLFIAERHGVVYLFDGQFSASCDDYPSHFNVFRLSSKIDDVRKEPDWSRLNEQGEHIAVVLADTIEFDVTRRKSISDRVFDSLTLETNHPPTDT